MFCLTDFKVHPLRVGSFNEAQVNKNTFSILFRNDNQSKEKLSRHSIAKAAKPLVYAASLCGTQLVRYGQNDLQNPNIIQKMYCIFVIITIILLAIFVNPSNLIGTSADIPLNILTKTLNFFLTTEFIHSLVAITFTKNRECINLFKTLDSVDAHFDTSRKIYKDKLIMALILLLIPCLQVSVTIALRRFDIINLGLYLTVFQNILQKSLISFFVLNIYIKYLMFNKILLTKMKSRRMILLRDSKIDIIIRFIFRELKFMENAHSNFCWFELMQIYDKISDSIQIFNNIFMWQVFLIFNEWFLITLLSICKSLSSTTKNFYMFRSDLFKYIIVNSRQMILVKLGDLLKKERKKTMSILMQILLEQEMDKDYYDQVQALINLMEQKNMEISANVFVADIQTVLNFSGQAISFTVLMIQYFYMNKSSE